MRQRIVCWVGLMIVFGAAIVSAEGITLDELKGPMTWGGVENVTKLRHLYFSGQPDQAALAAAQKAGIKRVINLRSPSEMDFDEASAVAALGMTYANVPLGGRSFERDAIEKIEAEVAAHPGVPTLIHCSSSNRAGGWLATHLVTRHQSSIHDALAIGRKAGITKHYVETSVRSFVEANDSPRRTGDSK